MKLDAVATKGDAYIELEAMKMIMAPFPNGPSDGEATLRVLVRQGGNPPRWE